MLLTRICLAKAPKSKFILTISESTVSGHRFYWARERTAEKLEFIHFDPFVRARCVYKEVKKLKSVKGNVTNPRIPN